MVSININILLEEESIHNLAFIKALLMKYSIEELNISHSQKEEIKKQFLKELKNFESV